MSWCLSLSKIKKRNSDFVIILYPSAFYSNNTILIDLSLKMGHLKKILTPITESAIQEYFYGKILGTYLSFPADVTIDGDCLKNAWLIPNL